MLKKWAFLAAFIHLLTVGCSKEGPWQNTDDSIEDLRSLFPSKNFVVELESQPKSGSLTIAGLRLVSGRATPGVPSAGGHSLVILDESGRLLRRVFFAAAGTRTGPPPLPGETTGEQSVITPETRFSLSVPWTPGAAQIQIWSGESAVVASRDLTSLWEENIRPAYRYVTGRKFLGPTAAASPAASDGFLDITFIGSGYNSAELPLFHQDVTRFTNELLQFEPFRSRAAQIRFNSVDNVASLSCQRDAQIPRVIACDNSLVTQIVLNSGAPIEKIFVISNETEYGGSGGPIAVAYRGSWGPRVFVHEFGHSLGHLMDEYNLYTQGGGVDGRVHENCYAGAPPAAEWAGIVVPSDYALGCNFPNWYRSSPTSIMYSLDTSYFNAVSQRLLAAQLPSLTPVSPPAAPSSLRAVQVTSSMVVLAWTDNSDNEETYVVLRSRKLHHHWSPYFQIARLSQNTSSYSDPTVAPRARYRYLVLAQNLAGQSNSNALVVKTPR